MEGMIQGPYDDDWITVHTNYGALGLYYDDDVQTIYDHEVLTVLS